MTTSMGLDDLLAETESERDALAADLAALRSENARLNQIINARTDDIVERARVMAEQEKTLEILRRENARLREALQDAVHLINTMASNPALSGRVFADFDRTPLGMKICAALAPAAKEQ